MAKVKSPLMCQEARGAIGGFEFRQSQFGPIVGRRSITPRKRTQSQLSARALLTRASKSWLDLPESTKQAWIQFATPPQDGRTAWIQAYIRLSRWDITPGESPQIQQTPVAINDFQITAAGIQGPYIGFSWTYDPLEHRLINVFGLFTTSRRQNPTHSRGTYCGRFLTDDIDFTIFPNFPAPVIHLWLEEIDQYSGQILLRNLYRFQPDWQ